MNKYIEEYKNMSLCDFADELDEPLFTIKQNLTQAIYFHYAKERDENFKLQERIEYLERSNNRREETIELERKENLELHNKIDKVLKKINFYMTTEWGLRGYSVLKEIEEILKDSDVDE